MFANGRRRPLWRRGQGRATAGSPRIHTRIPVSRVLQRAEAGEVPEGRRVQVWRAGALSPYAPLAFKTFNEHSTESYEFEALPVCDNGYSPFTQGDCVIKVFRKPAAGTLGPLDLDAEIKAVIDKLALVRDCLSLAEVRQRRLRNLGKAALAHARLLSQILAITCLLSRVDIISWKNGLLKRGYCNPVTGCVLFSGRCLPLPDTVLISQNSIVFVATWRGDPLPARSQEMNSRSCPLA